MFTGDQLGREMAKVLAPGLAKRPRSHQKSPRLPTQTSHLKQFFVGLGVSKNVRSRPGWLSHGQAKCSGGPPKRNNTKCKSRALGRHFWASQRTTARTLLKFFRPSIAHFAGTWAVIFGLNPVQQLKRPSFPLVYLQDSLYVGCPFSTLCILGVKWFLPSSFFYRSV